ncbi:MAG: hypothetical protein ACJA0U_001120 [Salibacteraceae bacterium]|jgi:hypothetical protein
MKITFHIIAVSALLFSCNQSAKGNWTEEDMDKVRVELEPIKTDLESTGIDYETILKCVIEKSEERYSSFEDADADFAGCREIFDDCIKELSSSSESIIGNWSKEDLNKMELSMDAIRRSEGDGYPELESFIECYSGKAIANYNSFAEANNDPYGCIALGDKCRAELGIKD